MTPPWTVSASGGFIVIGIPLWVVLLFAAASVFNGVSAVLLAHQKYQYGIEYESKMAQIIDENRRLRQKLGENQ